MGMNNHAFLLLFLEGEGITNATEMQRGGRLLLLLLLLLLHAFSTNGLGGSWGEKEEENPFSFLFPFPEKREKYINSFSFLSFLPLWWWVVTLYRTVGRSLDKPACYIVVT